MDDWKQGISLRDIEWLTGVTFKTLKKRLGGLEPARRDGVSIYYNPRDALRHIMNPRDAASKLDLAQERAKLAREQTLKTSLENQKLAGGLVIIGEARQLFAERVARCRSRLLAIPSRVATLLIGLSSTEIEQNVKTVIEEAMSELSVPESQGDCEPSVSEAGSAAETLAQ